MSTEKYVKPSNYENAAKQMAKFEGIECPKVVKMENADHYVLLVVKKTHIPAEERYDIKVTRQLMVPGQYELVKKSNPIQGEVIVLHDPTKKKSKTWKALTDAEYKKLMGIKEEETED